jgi:hypothetical protein
MRRFVIILLLLAFPGLAQAGKTVKVKVEKSTVFEQPRFFAKVVTTVKYGDHLEMLEETNDWARVRFGEHRGWIHKSCLTSARLNLGAILVGGSSSSTTEDEVALAGKGFTPEVEQGYKGSHQGMNYALVDEIERYEVDDDSLHDFITQGGLRIKEAE